MKRNVILIILLAAAAVIFTVALIIGLTGGFSMFRFHINFNSRTFSAYTYPDSDLYSRGNTELSTQGIEKLDINWLSDNVTIEKHSGSMISVSEEKSEALNEDEKLCYLVKDGVLYVKFCSPRNTREWELDKEKRLTVRIPESMGALQECRVETVSADMQIKKIAAEKFNLDSTSGSIQLSGEDLPNSNDGGSVNISRIYCRSTSGSIKVAGNAQNVELNSTSGDVAFAGTAQSAALGTTSGSLSFAGIANTLNAGSVSGSVKAAGQFGKVNCGTTSGSIIMAVEADDVKCSSTSGDVSLEFGVCPSSVDAHTTSGQIRLTVPGDKGFTANYYTTSGRFNCELPVNITDNRAVYGDGSAQFNLSSTSGNISIKQK